MIVGKLHFGLVCQARPHLGAGCSVTHRRHLNTHSTPTTHPVDELTFVEVISERGVPDTFILRYGEPDPTRKGFKNFLRYFIDTDPGVIPDSVTCERSKRPS